MQSVAVAAFRIVSWNKDVIVELVLIVPLPIASQASPTNITLGGFGLVFGYPFGKGIKSSGN